MSAALLERKDTAGRITQISKQFSVCIVGKISNVSCITINYN